MSLVHPPLGLLLPSCGLQGAATLTPNALQEGFPGHSWKGVVGSAEKTQKVLSSRRSMMNPYKATGKNRFSHMLDSGDFVSTFIYNTPFLLHEDPGG